MHEKPGAPPPVFVDRTGRRRRLTVIAGTAMGLGLLASLALILAGLFMDTSVAVPGWSDDRAPVEAEVNGGDLDGASPAPRPEPATSTEAPRPMAGPSTAPAPGNATARPTSTDQPGKGDERRNTAKPSRSPGRPG